MRKPTVYNFDGWYARIDCNVLCTNPDDHFPFDLGAVTLTSFDDERNLIIDVVSTNYTINKDNIEFWCKLDTDTYTFPIDEENNYKLLLEDLFTCEATLYCGIDEGGNEDSKYFLDRGRFHVTLFFRDGTEVRKKLTLE